MSDSAVTEAAEKEKLELRIRFRKDELAAQGNCFDQTDSKTGVALGFMFVAVGQLLGSMIMKRGPGQAALTLGMQVMFYVSMVSVALALLSGVVCRWPAAVHSTVELEPSDFELTVVGMLANAAAVLDQCATDNAATLKRKGRWAQATYFFVAMALTCYLVLLMMVFEAGRR
jgi:hypothetical protein